MRNTPTSQEIEHCMELTGMDYIQARNHLISREHATERAREERAQAIRRALGPELPKRIDWDQAKLAQIAANIASAGEDPAEFIDTKLLVSERKYGALPESWRKGFEPARTVRTGKPKFWLVLNEGAN